MIFAGIISRAPDGLLTLIGYQQAKVFGEGIIIYCHDLNPSGFGCDDYVVVFVQEAERRILFQYAKRVVGRKMYGGQSHTFRIKVNVAGVMPIIFAMSLMTFPPTIINLIWGARETGPFLTYLKTINEKHGLPLLMRCWSCSSRSSTMIAFNPVELANNIKKNGGFVPGIRPGKPTADYITKVLNRDYLVRGTISGIDHSPAEFVQTFTKLGMYGSEEHHC